MDLHTGVKGSHWEIMMGQILFDTWNMGESPQLGSSVTKYDSGEIFPVTQIKLRGWLKLGGGREHREWKGMRSSNYNMCNVPIVSGILRANGKYGYLINGVNWVNVTA